eukprot:354978_1
MTYYKNEFDMECYAIPSFQIKPLIIYEDVFCYNTMEWLETISLSTYYQLALKKAVLIICEDIKSANMIEKKINSEIQYKQHLRNISKYTRDDNEEKLCIEAELDIGDVIVATNLAGRGTDIKLKSDVRNYGGLHVCITFEPENERIKNQNLGRTCRAGLPGSAVIIINRDSCKFCSGNGEDCIKTVQYQRKQESQQFIENLGNKLKELSQCEDYYHRFDKLINRLKKDKPKIVTRKVVPQIHYKWSITYQEIQERISKGSDKASVQQLYQTFEDTIINDIEGEDYYGTKFKIDYNPYYLIQQAAFAGIDNNATVDERLEMLDESQNKLGETFSAISAFWKAAVMADKIKPPDFGFWDNFSSSKRKAYDDKVIERKKNIKRKVNESIELFRNNQNRIQLWIALYSTSHVKSGKETASTDIELFFAAESKFWAIVIEACNKCNANMAKFEEFKLTKQNISQYLAERDDFDPMFIKIIKYYSQCGLISIWIIEKAPSQKQRMQALFVVVVGAIQVAVGSCLILSGVGAAAGGFLIGSGLGDMYKGVIGAIKGEFDLQGYFANKMIEVGVALITAGIGGVVKPDVWEICTEFAIEVARTEAPKALRACGMDALADVTETLFAFRDISKAKKDYKKLANSGKATRFDKIALYCEYGGVVCDTVQK